MRARVEDKGLKRAACILSMAMILLLANAGALLGGRQMVWRARGVRSTSVRKVVLRPVSIAPRHAAPEIEESCAVCYASATKSEDAPLLSDWWAALHCALCRLYQG